MTRLPLLGFALLSLSAFAQQPELIDRRLFFEDPEISGAQISPDGRFIAFMKPLDSVRNVWVKKTAEPFSAARPVTADTKRPIPGYFWSRDGKYILFIQDKAGDENFNIFGVDPAAAAPEGARTPPARDLSGVQGAQTQIYSLPKNDPDTIFIGLNDRDKSWHDLYKLKLSTGEKTLVRKNTEKIAGWTFDLSGQLRLATRTTNTGDNEILRVDADGFKQIYSCDVFEQCNPLRFHKDGKRVYLRTNKGADVDLEGLQLMDVSTGKVEPVETDPQKGVDLAGAVFSQVSDELMATVYVRDKVDIRWRDKAREADHNLLKKKLPGREVNLGSCSLDENLCLVTASSDVEPGETYLFNRKNKDLTLQYKIREQLPRNAMAAMEVIRYKSSDGLDIPAYLTLPKGVKRPVPLIVLPHGGPWGRDTWGYNGLAQFLANRGYAVLRPNFRASVGFGKKFVNLGNGKWGETMQDDLTWGVKHLVAQGIADPKRVGIMGGSYGGYATLAGVTFTPDLYAAGVAIVAPSNLISLLEAIPPYWEAGRRQLYKRMADPGTPEGKAQLARQSPLNSAAKIKTPLMVVQGANDPRVPKSEADQIVIALRDRGFPVEYLVAPDEGHGFARPINNLAMYFAAEKFLAKHLGGRYQEDATAETSGRLSTITVDPKTVVLAKKVDPSAAGKLAPVADLTAGTYNYEVTILRGDQPVKMKTSTTIKEENGQWSVVDKMVTPMGDMTDVSVIDKGTLAPLKRAVRQGPVSIDIEVKGSKATGKMGMNGQEKPIDVDLGGPLYADFAGAPFALAALPLAPGYSATFRNFDVMKQKAKLMQLNVEGEESVTVAAGTFDAWKLVLTSAEGGSEKVTLWVAKKERKPVKVAASMPQMGGATMTTELQ